MVTILMKLLIYIQVLVAINGIDCFTIAVKFTRSGSLEHVSIIRTDHGITCPKVRLLEAVSISCSSFSSCIGIMVRNDSSKVALASVVSMSTDINLQYFRTTFEV